MTPRFDTNSVRDYRNTHGHAPRGDGYWIFDATYVANDGSVSFARFSVHGSFSRARAAALSYFRMTAPGAAVSVDFVVCT